MKRLAKILALVLLVITCGAVVKTLFMQPKIQAAGPSGAGVNIDPTAFAPSPEELNQAGVKWVRLVYKSTTYDYLSLLKSYKAAGINTVMIFNQETSWPPTADGKFDQQYVHNFGELAKKLVTSFGNNVAAYEIWNEEDNQAVSPDLPYVPPANYAMLLSGLYNAIKSVDKSKIVLVGGLEYGDPTYLDNVAANIVGGKIPADGIGVHPYIINVPALVASVKNYIAHSQGLPLWITEFGWETNEGTPPGADQADYLCAVYTQLQLDPSLNSHVAVAQWYTWTDLYNPGFGLLTSDGHPKPSYYAFQKCASQYTSTLTPAQLVQLYTEAMARIQSIINSIPNSSNPGVSHPPDYSPSRVNDTVTQAFHPLGSLEKCPPEIPINGKFGQNNGSTGACSNSTQITKLLDLCQHPEKLTEKNGKNGAGEPLSINWCPSQYAGPIGNYVESLPADKRPFCKNGSIKCNAEGQCKERSPKECVVAAVGEDYNRICDNPLNDLNGNPTGNNIRSCKDPDKDWAVSYCNWAKNGFGDPTNPNNNQSASETNQGLPTCVPTNDKNNPNRCVSECSPPVNLEENLQLSGNCLNGDCQARITIDQNKFYLPFAARLGDYFAGILDAEHLGPVQLDAIQSSLRNGLASPAAQQHIFDQAGVARKLLPSSIQDKLRCDFRNYVREKLQTGANTKYLDRSDPKNIKQFKIFDKNITEIECPPSVDPGSKYSTDAQWSNVWKKYWFAIPLFPNDESLGEIQFVSPSVFSNNANSPTLKDQNGNPVKVGPIYVSLPDIQRLNLVTAFIQGALMPESEVQQQITPETVGRQFTPTTKESNVCLPGWAVAYDSTLATETLGKAGHLSEFDRGVSCNIPNLIGSNDSGVCTIDPNGQLRCGNVTPAGANKAGCQGSDCNGPYSQTVQVRTVFPHLYDIAEQTISPVRGLLQIFKPTVLKTAVKSGANLDTADQQFEENFKPIPASINGVHYKVESDNNSLQIQDKTEGWQIFFYKLGGLWTARNFVLDLLNPEMQKSTKP